MRTIVMVLALSLFGCAESAISQEEKVAPILRSYSESYAKLKPCYTAYGRDSNVQFLVQLTVNTFGLVQFAEIDKESAELPYRSNGEFDACVRRTILAMEFPQYSTGDHSGFRIGLPVVFPISK